MFNSNDKISKAAIIIPVEVVYNEVKNLFRQELPKTWFDNNEVDEIIGRIFNIILSNIFNTIENRDSVRYENSYQSMIDYLEYCGISQQTAFKIVHFLEMNILRTIFNTYGSLDDKSSIKILDYHFVNYKDLIIIVQTRI